MQIFCPRTACLTEPRCVASCCNNVHTLIMKCVSNKKKNVIIIPPNWYCKYELQLLMSCNNIVTCFNYRLHNYDMKLYDNRREQIPRLLCMCV